MKMHLTNPIIHTDTTNTLSLEQLKELETVKSRPIDTTDIPELTAEEAEKLHFKYYKRKTLPEQD